MHEWEGIQPQPTKQHEDSVPHHPDHPVISRGACARVSWLVLDMEAGRESLK